MNDGVGGRGAAVSRGSAWEIGSSSCHAGSTSVNGAVDRRFYVAISRIPIFRPFLVYARLHAAWIA